MNTSAKKHIMIVAGESSGDIHAANLIHEIKRIDPDIAFSGLGGQCLAEEGVELYADLTKLAVIGFIEVLKHFWKVKQLFNLFLKKVDTAHPDAVILVDYPGFNLRLAKELKKRSIKVIYYISPQVWAWKEKRVDLIRNVADRMMVFYEFEKSFYAQRGLTVDFVGNPLIDHIEVNCSRQTLLKEAGLNPDLPTIGLLPGSRTREIEQLLPVMIHAAHHIRRQIPTAQFLLTKAKHLNPILINKYIRDADIPIAVMENEFHNCIHACDICIVASGTAALETALLEKPMVVIYKTHWLTYLLGKILVKIQWMSLVNIIAQKEIVPECLQKAANGKTIAEKLLAIYTNPFKMESTINALKDVKKKLGPPGAAKRAAEIVLSEISHSET